MDFPLSYLVPLALSLLFGGAIGLERELHGRPAGLRTHILVCLSSTMLIMTSHRIEAGELELGGIGRLVLDPNRMAAGIVTGIGFLGAATVLRSGDFVRGLTTAACIWFVAGLGIVLGDRQYVLGLIGTVIVLLVLTLFNHVTAFVRPVVYRRLIVLSTRTDVARLLSEVDAILEAEDVKIMDVASGHDNGSSRSELVLYLSLKNQLQAPGITQRVAQLDGVESARWKLIMAQ